MEDKYEHYNYEQDKFMHCNSGKNRSKKEASEHTNRFDVNGHTRKIVSKIYNTEVNRKMSK